MRSPGTTAEPAVTMSYTVCSNCGQKALTVATRCPRCGLAFEAQFLGRAVTTPKPRRTLLALLIAGAVLATFVSNGVIRWLDAPAPAPAPAPAAPPPPLPAAPRVPPSPTPKIARREVPNSTTAVPGTTPKARRYASTWVNVRAARRNSAPVLGILHPGEAVQVDSLAQGWYRVVSDRLAPGYADRSLLDTAPGPGPAPAPR